MEYLWENGPSDAVWILCLQIVSELTAVLLHGIQRSGYPALRPSGHHTEISVHAVKMITINKTPAQESRKFQYYVRLKGNGNTKNCRWIMRNEFEIILGKYKNIHQPNIKSTELQPPYFTTDASHNTVITERCDIMGQNHSWRSWNPVP